MSDLFIGVDGCAQGWVAVAISNVGFVEAARFSTFAALKGRFGEAKVIGVDMPLGLVDGGDREADAAVRGFLVGQASSVFSSPARPVLAATSYEDAQRLSRRASGKGLSKQSFAIVPKIREVDGFVDDDRVREVHPEVSFRLLNREARLARKTTWGGMQTRLALLSAAGIVLPPDLGDVNDVGVDDVIDAAAAAWSAGRIAQGAARAFPASPSQRDRGGRVIATWG